MTQAEFSTMMVELECIINKLTKGLQEECDNETFMDENGEMNIDRYLQGRNIVKLAESLTTTKLSIHYMHKQVYEG